MPDDLKSLISAKRRPIYASWHTMGAPVTVEMAAAIGWDIALIDQQHGVGGNESMLAHLTAARAGGVPGIVRVAWNDPALISRALDAGAVGVVCPMVNSGDEARALRDAAKYPPLGNRSWGPYRAALAAGGDYLADANRATLAIAQIETSAAVGALDDILATDGIDAALVGPNDLALSLTGERNIRAPAVLDAISSVLAACRKHGKVAWIFANDRAYADARAADGWDILSVGTDAGWLTTGAQAMLSPSE